MEIIFVLCMSRGFCKNQGEENKNQCVKCWRHWKHNNKSVYSQTPGCRVLCHFSSFRDWTQVSRVSCIGRQIFFLTTEPLGSPCSNVKSKKVLVVQSCPTLCDPMDCSPPGSSVHGTLQARILKWVAIPFSRLSSWPRHWTGSLHCRPILYRLSHQG